MLFLPVNVAVQTLFVRLGKGDHRACATNYQDPLPQNTRRSFLKASIPLDKEDKCRSSRLRLSTLTPLATKVQGVRLESLTYEEQSGTGNQLPSFLSLRAKPLERQPQAVLQLAASVALSLRR
jgi:hypothetical protein